MKFKREDFTCKCPHPVRHYDWCEAQENADLANDRLEEMIADAPMILGTPVTDEKGRFIWFVADKFHRPTHSAKLIHIQEIKEVK